MNKLTINTREYELVKTGRFNSYFTIIADETEESFYREDLGAVKDNFHLLSNKEGTPLSAFTLRINGNNYGLRLIKKNSI